MGGKLYNGIKSMHVNSLVCVKGKEGESECFKIDCGMGQECILSPPLFNVYVDIVT